jgi:hypothetical protein
MGLDEMYSTFELGASLLDPDEEEEEEEGEEEESGAAAAAVDVAAGFSGALNSGSNAKVAAFAAASAHFSLSKASLAAGSVFVMPRI